MGLLIASMLGRWGLEVLRLYEANALLVNGTVLVYGILMVLSWDNLMKSREQLVACMLEDAESLHTARSLIADDPASSAVTIPWAKVAAARSFPLIAKRLALWPNRISPASLQRLLPAKELFAEVAKRLDLTR